MRRVVAEVPASGPLSGDPRGALPLVVASLAGE